jgi:hypothetical protein
VVRQQWWAAAAVGVISGGHQQWWASVICDVRDVDFEVAGRTEGYVLGVSSVDVSNTERIQWWASYVVCVSSVGHQQQWSASSVMSVCSG